MSGSESEYDPVGGVVYTVNETEVATEKVMDALASTSPEMAALTRWASNNSRDSRRGTIFNRDRFLTPSTIFEQFKTATDAAESDDVVAGVVETTEQLAFKRIAAECEDFDEEDIWNQILDDLDLVTRMREVWRELFVLSQCYVAVNWGRKTYKLSGKSSAGNKKRKTFDLVVPAGITILDPLKVIPVGNFMMNQEKLAYIVDSGYGKLIDQTLADKNSSDLVTKQLIQGPFDMKTKESQYEMDLIKEVTGAQYLTDKRLFYLNPENVWRITSTRPHYQRFATVRMKSVFELLDLKNLLREMDRAHLMGAANFIVIVRKGSDEYPAKPAELAALATQVKTVARVPLIVSDHRLEVEIVTPKMDKTLNPERYNTLDSRITSRLYQVLSSGNYSSGTAVDDSIKLIRVIAASMEARRDTIRDSFQTHILKQIYEKNDSLKYPVKLQFYPRRIALDFDPNIATFMQDLRDRGDISRETILAELDILEKDEAWKREREAEMYDDAFYPVYVPFSGGSGGDSPDGSGSSDGGNSDSKNGDSGTPGNTRSVGRRGGGRTGGGGMNRQSVSSGPGRGTTPKS